jgi:hypothetical protein
MARERSRPRRSKAGSARSELGGERELIVARAPVVLTNGLELHLR